MKSKLVIMIFLASFPLFFSNCDRLGKDSIFNMEPRQEILFDFDWKFHRGDAENAHLVEFDDSAWRLLDLPHDWSIEDIPGTISPIDSSAIGGINTGYFVGGTGWYRKTFTVPQELEGKRFSILFGGVYMDTDVWLNGVHLGNHPYGYTAFEFDLTDLIKPGEENVLAVEVKNEGRNSRWYSGSGIYRHVWLKVFEPVHIKTWGIGITTSEISEENATVNISTEIVNKSKAVQPVEISGTVFNSAGKKVAEFSSNLESEPDSVMKNSQSVSVKTPKLWSIETPELYKTVIEIKDKKGKTIDKKEEHFGIRTIDFNVENGFLLNGKPVLLKGACVHHDNGPLGAAAFDRAEERRVELLKANGFNAIRCAHNPPSVAFLDACDRLGMLVIDEAFDMWRRPKNPQDYSNYFDEWWQKDMEAMVLRDRNHPSIIMWSTGNEIPERGEPEGAVTSRMLAEYVKNLDPTRPVTAAVNGLNPDKDPYFATLGISGYNYSFGGDHGKKSIFAIDHERVPDRIMYCAESYPLEAFGAWMDVKNHSYVFGDFVWTGFDYLGEASIGWRGYPHDENFYPWNQAFCGDIDICGFKRPQSFYRDVLWGVGDQLSIFVKPPVPSFPKKENRASWSKWHWHDHVADWNWKGYENQNIEVIVYSGHEKVELFLNGESMGTKETNSDNEFMAVWNIPFQPGELKAVAMVDENVKAEHVLKSANTPAKIQLTSDRTKLFANGQDLSFITFELLDENGIRNPKAENLIQFEIEGPGEIVAVASSNPMSTESFQQTQRKAWQGRGLVIIKSQNRAGEIVLRAKSDGMLPAEIKIESN
ncbi:MAG: glycoside hydrolase family 2 TIM barrel-domain containing protein [Mariniphaga sp.]|nr:glycoside hydrolase family 2 TIM barrel-domain containing protein [Mariniphaga sp.]